MENLIKAIKILNEECINDCLQKYIVIAFDCSADLATFGALPTKQQKTPVIKGSDYFFCSLPNLLKLGLPLLNKMSNKKYRV